MRMRRKKNLDSRLEKCSHLRLKEEKVSSLSEVFGNDNPVYMEIGCGKGKFVEQIALRNPDINFIAVEMVSNVCVSAMELVEAAGLKNVRFLIANAENIGEIFAEQSISRIYLNFSCPYPKRRYTKHRLTHERFLKQYRKILIPYGEIHLKTDKKEFFEFSLNSFCECGFTLKNICFDLHSSDFEGNIVTEYEQRFVSQGLPIYRVEAVNDPRLRE